MEQRIYRINRDSFEPAYLQLVNILRDRVARGDFRSGKPLPSESQLCKEYDISPMTVRRAINVLLDQGVVYTERGRGTFVKPLQLEAVTFGLGEFTSLFQNNHSTRVKLLQAKIVRADERTAAQLGIAPGERSIGMTSLIVEGDTPLIYRWGVPGV